MELGSTSGIVFKTDSHQGMQCLSTSEATPICVSNDSTKELHSGTMFSGVFIRFHIVLRRNENSAEMIVRRGKMMVKV